MSLPRPLILWPRSRNLPTRSYALSRFPDRRPARRARQTVNSDIRKQEVMPDSSSDLVKNQKTSWELRPSIEVSELWHTVNQRPLGDPENGLRKLLLENDILVVTRQLEMLNIFVGFEQANKYVISNEDGEHLGYIAEEPRGILSMFSRQLFRTHRPFRAIIMDAQGSPVLWLRRPFSWINSRMFVQHLKDLHEHTASGQPVLDTFAEVQQRWHLWRRRYDLFLRDTPARILSTASEPQPEPSPDLYSQFARVDGGFLEWNFKILNAEQRVIAHVDRAFRGFGRELFTDTGQYHVRFRPNPANVEQQTPERHSEPPTHLTTIRELTLSERALILALAVDIDFDYFSHHSEGRGQGLLWFLSHWGD